LRKTAYAVKGIGANCLYRVLGLGQEEKHCKAKAESSKDQRRFKRASGGTSEGKVFRAIIKGEEIAGRNHTREKTVRTMSLRCLKKLEVGGFRLGDRRAENTGIAMWYKPATHP